jgi:hypothetical protein
MSLVWQRRIDCHIELLITLNLHRLITIVRRYHGVVTPKIMDDDVDIITALVNNFDRILGKFYLSTNIFKIIKRCLDT